MGCATSSPATVIAKRDAMPGGVQRRGPGTRAASWRRPRPGCRRRAARRPARRRRAAARRRGGASSMTSSCSSAISASPSPGRPSIDLELARRDRVRRADQVALVLHRERAAVAARTARPRHASTPPRCPAAGRRCRRGRPGGEARVTSRTLRDRSARLAPQEPDRRALGQLELVDDREAVAPVEGEVALLAGLQVGRQPLAVAEVEARAGSAASRCRGPGAPGRRPGPRGRGGARRDGGLDLLEAAQDARQPRQHAGQRRANRRSVSRVSSRQRPGSAHSAAPLAPSSDVQLTLLAQQPPQLPGEEALRLLRPARLAA